MKIFPIAIIALLVSFGASAQDVVPQTAAQINLSYAPLVKKIAPAVVNIYTKKVVNVAANPLMADPFFGQFFGRGMGVPQQRLESSLGSGVIVDASGLVVTNAHVVKDASEVSVVLSDGREFHGELKLVDTASDVALVRLDAKNEKLPFASLQPSDSLEVGDLVIAIGNPFGVGQTVTSGIVSALARSSLNINDFNFFIQTDAAINPGNSGGPLVSMSGGVVGINSAIFSQSGGSLGIGFAIPSEMVATVISAEKSGQIDKQNHIVRPWVGTSVQDVTSDIAASLGITTPSGALVTGLHAESPALKAGLKVGDLITDVNGRKVHNAAELRFRFALAPIGQKLAVGYTRKGEKATAEIESLAPPDSPPRTPMTITGRTPLSGATLININPAVEVELGLKDEDKGVVVTKIETNSIALRVVSPGDIIVAINKRPVKSSKDVQGLLDKAKTGWAVTIRRQGQNRTVFVH